MMNEKLMRVSHVSKALGVCDRTTRRLIESGSLKAIRIAKRWMVSPSDLQDFLVQQSNRRAA